MTMYRQSEVIIPLQGCNNKLFGVKYLKLHGIRDAKWTAEDKHMQYLAIKSLHEKDQKLRTLERIAERKKQKARLALLKKQVRNDRIKLKTALYGDVQRTKNLLQDHKELQRLYQCMPPHLIVENMDHRTFVKRKELDRLICRKNQLSIIYQEKLLEASEIQDNVKYRNINQDQDELKAKKLRMELKNSETRLRAIKTIGRAYTKIIHTMMHDSLYFEPVLNALQEDINEQSGFIEKTIKMGLPALENLEQLTDEFNILEKKTRKDIQLRMTAILENREKIANTVDNKINLVRRDSDYDVYPTRYNRETSSMMTLKNQVEDVEKIMKLIKNATSCATSENVFPRMKKQIRDNTRLENNLIRRERERNVLLDKDNHGVVINEALEHNLTEEETGRIKQIEELRKEIDNEENKQKQHIKHMKKRGNILCLLRSAFQHLFDVLKDINPEHMAMKAPYPTSDLNLPLLKFAAILPKAKPPPPFEEDIQTLITVVKDRVTSLMENYSEEKPKEEIDRSFSVYHQAIVDDLAEEEVKPTEETTDTPLILGSVADDPNVPNRSQIKATSQKIVDLHAKQDD